MSDDHRRGWFAAFIDALNDGIGDIIGAIIGKWFD